MIVVATEFGRPAEFDAQGGRGHQSGAFSTLFAGGGIRGGQAVGETDEIGETIVDRQTTVPDYFATLFGAMGIDPAKNLYASSRPVPITDHGQPVKELFG